MTQKSRTDLLTEIASNIDDNSAGDITAADVRGALQDLADSNYNLITDGSIGSQWTTSGSNIYYNAGNVGVGTSTPLVKEHVVANLTTVAAPTAFTASLVQESLAAPTPMDSVSLIYGPLNITSGSGSENSGYTGYGGADSVQATVYSYRFLEGQYQVSQSGFDLGMVNLSTANIGIDWSWSSVTNGDGSAVDGYIIVVHDLSANTTYSYDVSTATSYADMNIGGAVSYIPFASSITAVAQSFSYDICGTATSPSGGSYFSAPNSSNATDFYNNGSLIWVQHIISGSGGGNWREVENSGSGFDGTGDQTFYEKAPYSGSGTITPNHYGFLSDGNTLNRDYRAITRNTSPATLYSAGFTGDSTIDPNDGSYYYFAYSGTTAGQGLRIVEQINGGGFNGSIDKNGTSVSFVQDAAGGSFLGSTISNPTLISSAAVIAENSSNSSVPIAQMILKTSNSAGVLRLEMQEASNGVKAFQQRDNNGVYTFFTDQNVFRYLSASSITSPSMQFMDSGLNFHAGIASDGSITARRASASAQTCIGTGPGDSSHTQILLDNTSILPITPINGGIEFSSNVYYGTDSTTRRQFIRSATAAALSSSTIPVANASGLLTNSSITDNGSFVTFSIQGVFQQGLGLSAGKSLTMGIGSTYLGGLRTNYASLSASASLNISNHSPITVFTGSTASQTLTLPTALNISGTVFEISNEASVAVTVATTGAQSLNTGTGTVTSLVLQPGDRAKFIATASSTWDVTSRTQWISSGADLSFSAGKVNLGAPAVTTGLFNVGGAITVGLAAATTAQLTVLGGASGQPIITLKRTSGGTATYSWALAGSGLTFSDDISGNIIGNFQGDNSLNEFYIGQKNKGATTTRDSVLGGTTLSSAAGTDQAAVNLRIYGPLGTGAGATGDINFYTGNLLASGTTQHSQTNRVTIKGNTGYFGIGITPVNLFQTQDTATVTTTKTFQQHNGTYTVSTGGQNITGIYNALHITQNDATTAVSNLQGGQFISETVGGSGAVTNMYGNQCIARINGGTGNVAFAAGILAQVSRPSGTGVIATGAAFYAPAQTATGITNAYGFYAAGASDSNYIAGYLGIGALTPTAFLDTPASTTARATIRIRSGTAPTSPNDGDMWYDGTNLKFRVGGTTKTVTLT